MARNKFIARNCEQCSAPFATRSDRVRAGGGKHCSRRCCHMSRASERFWSKVDVRGPDECWPWLAVRIPRGYGRVKVNGKSRPAHVVAYELATGKTIPPGMEACHSCDARYPLGSTEYTRCCNPAHIWPGTHQENVDDCVRKGRMHMGDLSGSRRHPEKMSRGPQPDWATTHPGMIRYGEANNATKLTENDVRAIRGALTRGESQTSIAHRHGVVQTTVSRIKLGQKWAWLK